jgi:heat shock protein HspQ
MDPSATPAADPVHARPGQGTAPRVAKYRVGDVVKHRFYPFRGIIFDIDPVFNSTEDWWQSIPAEIRPSKSQPYYHLLAENAKTEYIAYVSEQNLVPDTSGKALRHPQVKELFVEQDGTYRPVFLARH